MKLFGRQIRISGIIIWIVVLINITLIVVSIIESQRERICVNKSPIETTGYVIDKKITTGVGNPTVRIYYSFHANDTIVDGSSCPVYAVGKCLKIGDQVIIRYDSSDPNNSYLVTSPTQ